MRSCVATLGCDVSTPLGAERLSDMPTSSYLQTHPMNGPGLIRKAANFGKAVVKHVADGGKHVIDEVYLARLSVCANCPSLDPERMRCLEKSCGCRLKVKARWRSEPVLRRSGRMTRYPLGWDVMRLCCQPLRGDNELSDRRQSSISR